MSKKHLGRYVGGILRAVTTIASRDTLDQMSSYRARYESGQRLKYRDR